ncbi:hypothetical protein BDZ94DRAFT_1305877 [Collybia nuda]|uniref:RlpA-like protein double-psi beta-barrel domain-containing protein n=1 Tax=Collybia nuda TaxID=64659 RepID=A0A9P5YDT0_9AGAR|nr:hypothetical protein BDZ94DRAFT_1305877 [Collybia nuda]
MAPTRKNRNTATRAQNFRCVTRLGGEFITPSNKSSPYTSFFETLHTMLFVASALFTLSSLVSVRAFIGDVTVYTPGLGACGRFSTETDFVVAPSRIIFDPFPAAGGGPQQNPICGRNLRATYQGNSVVVQVVDRCVPCTGAYDLEMSPMAFSILAPLAPGRLSGVEWDWTNSAPGSA